MNEKKNHIVKVGDKYRLLSHEGKNLGTFDSHAAAAKHEGEVEWFKEHKNAAAGVVYRSGDQVLLMRRKEGSEYGGHWSLPAGHVENGETPGEAAHREFNEETGHDFDVSAMQSISNDGGFAAFTVSGSSFDVKMNDEHDAYKWAHIGDLPQPLHPGLETILRRESERQNASQEPRIFYCRHMRPGICGYSNETILVGVEAMKKLIASAKDRGIPVYIHHNDDSKEVRLKNLREQSVGFVTESFYNELDGQAWFKFLAVEDAAHKAIENGWRVSNAYIPSRWGPGGTENNVAYDREFLDGEFTHLAIVPDPRYESACIMTAEQFKAYQETKRRELEELRNSKEGNPIMKFFNLARKEATPAEITNDTQVELQNAEGKIEVVSVGAMIAAVKNSKTKMNETRMADEMMCEVDGEEMTVKELSNRYQKLNSERKNAEEEEEKKKKVKEEEEKENARKAKMNAEEEEERKKKEEDEKKNSGHFAEVANAAAKKASEGQTRTLETATDGIARGKARYGRQD